MSDAATLPSRFQALAAFGLRNMLELCKTVRVTAIGTGNPMLHDKRSTAAELMAVAAFERIAGLPIVPARRQAADPFRRCSIAQSAQEQRCRFGRGCRSGRRASRRGIVNLVCRPNEK